MVLPGRGTTDEASRPRAMDQAQDGLTDPSFSMAQADCRRAPPESAYPPA